MTMSSPRCEERESRKSRGTRSAARFSARARGPAADRGERAETRCPLRRVLSGPNTRNIMSTSETRLIEGQNRSPGPRGADPIGCSRSVQTVGKSPSTRL